MSEDTTPPEFDMDGDEGNANIDRLLAWADAALECAAGQRERAMRIGPRVVSTVHAESAAAVLCEELARDGLPVDRAALLALVEPSRRASQSSTRAAGAAATGTL